MKNIMNILCISLIAICSSRCSEGQGVPTAINTIGKNIEVRLAAYDEHGVERTQFEPGTNINFALNLSNASNQNVSAGYYFDYCELYGVEEFLLVYKWIKNDSGKELWVPVGKAYQSIDCPAIPIQVIVPANSDASVCGSTWHTNPDNVPLSSGKYYTALAWSLEIEGQSRELNLRLDFEVQ